MKTDQPHKQYIKAYLFWQIFTLILCFVVAIPIIWIGWLACACLGEEREVLKPMIPWLRSILAFILGYFVFRAVVKREILPQPKKSNTDNVDTESGARD